MSDKSEQRNDQGISRRGLLRAAGTAGIVGGTAGILGAFNAPGIAPAGELVPVKIGWAEPAACHAPLGYAEHVGIFAKHGIKAELVNFLSTGDDLLTKYLASGKLDVGAGFLLGWLKPLDEGLDVKLISATHAGCTRLLVRADSKIKSLSDLKGKTIAVAQLGGSAQQVFSVSLAKSGVNPETEVNWKLFPDNLLATTVQNGEADALAHIDPQTFGWIKHENLVEIANTQSGFYADLSCCTIGASTAFLKTNKEVIRNVVEAIIETHEFTANHPEEVAKYYFETFKPPVSLEDLTELLGQLAYHHHPAGRELEIEIANEIDDLKLINVFRANADSKALAKEFSYNVFE